MVPPAVAWQRLFLLQEVLLDRPDLARAVRRLPISDQFLLTIELLRNNDEPAVVPRSMPLLPPSLTSPTSLPRPRSRASPPSLGPPTSDEVPPPDARPTSERLPPNVVPFRPRSH